MISALIFIIHLIFIILLFYRSRNAESAGRAVINVLFVLLIFSVGWALTAFIINLIIPFEGMGKHFDRDTITLTLLTVAEVFFYKNFFRDVFISEDEKEK